MALTTTQKTEAYQFFIVAFGAATGVEYMNQLNDAYNAGMTTKQIVNVYTTKPQFETLYPRFDTNEQFAERLIENVVGASATAAAKTEAKADVAAALNAGWTKGDIVFQIFTNLAAKASTDAQWGKTSLMLANKVAVAQYITETQLVNTTDLTKLSSYIASVTEVAASVDAAKLAAQGANGQTFTLTTGVDSGAAFVGGAGNDIYNSSPAAGGVATVNSLDVLDGGAGQDTLNIVGQAFPAAATIKNIETLNIANDGGAVTVDAGKYGFNTVNTAGAATTVTNGKVVNVQASTTAAVSGAELSAVSVKNATGAVTVTNQTAAGTNATTLTAVSLESVNAGATLTGDAIAAVSLAKQRAASTIDLVNAASTALTVNVDGVGYSAAGAALAVGDVVVNAATASTKATALTINANGSKSNLTVNTGANVKALTIAGAADMILAGVNATALKTIDGSAATGGLTLGTLNAGTADVKTGAGKDSFQVMATKVTVDAGAGNDTVTLGSALAIGSTVKLGAGDDVLLSNGGSVVATDATGTVVIDGGDGVDTVAVSLINATNAKQFVNFERIDASAGATNLDVELMTGSTVGGVTLNGGAGTVTLQNLAAGAGLTVAGQNTGSLTIGVKGAVANAADTFAVTFAGVNTTAVATTASVTALGLEGVEAVTIASSGTGLISNVATLAGNTKLKTITITGDKALDLSFTAANGATAATTGVSSIDASASTGALKVDLANVKGVTAGVTVKGGSAADTFTTALESATLSGGAGNDVFDVKAAVATTALAATTVKTNITDFAAGDTIDLSAATDVVATLAKVTLTAGVQNLDQALDLVGATTKTVSWFNYGADTYVVYNADATNGLDVGDVLVKLTGTVDLSNATISATGVLALA